METTQTKEKVGMHTLYAIEPCTPDTLILICRLLHLRGYRGDSAVYIVPDHKNEAHGTARFFLALSDSMTAHASAMSAVALLEEYGTRIASSSILLCLSEHAVCLCAHGAVERISAL